MKGFISQFSQAGAAFTNFKYIDGKKNNLVASKTKFLILR
jgi:hypothetical protein